MDGITLEIAPGEIVGLLGPNGAGKTTTFYMMVGLVQPNEGRVILGDRDITSEPMYRRARMGVAYLAQEPSSFKHLSVEDNIWLILEALGVETRDAHDRIDRLLRRLRSRRSTGHSGQKPCRAASDGDSRSPALWPPNRPSFLLDEPFAGIDPLAVLDLQRIIRRLKSLGIGVLITDHNVRETLKITDRAYIIKDGKIFATGDPVDLSENRDVRRIYLGEDFRL